MTTTATLMATDRQMGIFLYAQALSAAARIDDDGQVVVAVPRWGGGADNVPVDSVHEVRRALGYGWCPWRPR